MTATPLLEVGVMFAAIALSGAIARRIDQSVIPFYIIAGIALSPFVVGRIDLPFAEGAVYITESDFIHVGAELGIVFLLFFLGLEFNLNRLLASRDRIGKAGTIDLVINFGIGFLMGLALFREFLPAFLVAGIVYISSSAIITKSLIDRGWIANDEAGPMLGTLVYEDLFIAIYLAIAATLVIGGEGFSVIIASLGLAFAFVLVLLLFVYFGTAVLERTITDASNESLILRVIGITVLIAGAALALGVSEAVAAFFVGMAFSSTDYVHELEDLLEPVRDTFAAIFFFWIGLITDPLLFAGVLGLIAIAVVVTTPTKLVSGFLGGRVYGLDTRHSTRVGLGMVTRGEFSLIIAAIAIGGAGIGLAQTTAETINAFAVGYVLFMSILGTMLMQYSGWFEDRAVSRFGA